MNKKRGIVFSNGLALGLSPSVDFEREKREKFYYPSPYSIGRLHKAVSKIVNDNQANITVSTYGYEVEF